MLMWRRIGRRSLDGRRYGDVSAWFCFHEGRYQEHLSQRVSDRVRQGRPAWNEMSVAGSCNGVGVLRCFGHQPEYSYEADEKSLLVARAHVFSIAEHGN